MKKLIAMLIAATIMLSVAYADTPDISGLSFNELIALRAEVNKALMSSDKYQEVTVPQGEWEVGTDIPAGKWLVKCSDVGRNSYILKECEITWGRGKPDNGRFDYRDRKGEATIANPNNKNYSGRVTEVIIDVEDGDYIVIDTFYNSAVFCTYTGKPDLGFK